MFGQFFQTCETKNFPKQSTFLTLLVRNLPEISQKLIKKLAKKVVEQKQLLAHLICINFSKIGNLVTE
jgi:hypothetical protein